MLEPARTNNLAAAALSRADWQGAMQLLAPLVREFPRYAPGWSNLAVAWQGLDDKAQALSVLQEGLAHSPAEPLLVLAHAELLLETDPAGALAALQGLLRADAQVPATQLDPALAQDRCACLLARAHEALGDGDLALHVLDQAVARSQAGGDIRLRHETGLREQALARHQEVFPTLGELRQPPYWTPWERALVLLRRGEWAAGFSAYESRLLWWGPRGWDDALRQRPWLGQPLRGRSILVAGEQGYGDQIMFWRFVPHLKALGARVWLGVNAPLKRLAGQWLDGEVEGVLAWGDALPDVDFHVPLCSLPHRLGLRHASELAWRAPVARSPGTLAAQRPAGARPLRVGLCWAGKSTHADDARRSIEWPRLEPLLASGAGRVCWVRVQPGWTGPATPALACEDDAVQDFADLGRLLGSLDAFVSVDSAPVHLAATLGLPVYMLDRALPDWRWGRGEADARRWYPTLQVLRQSVPGRWDEPLARAAAAIAGL